MTLEQHQNPDVGITEIVLEQIADNELALTVEGRRRNTARFSDAASRFDARAALLRTAWEISRGLGQAGMAARVSDQT